MRTQEFLEKAGQPVTMRVAGPEDRPALERLAALDSTTLTGDRMLVAEVGGELRAAVSADGSTAIADPFRLTSDVVALLRERATQMREGGSQESGNALGLRLARAA